MKKTEKKDSIEQLILQFKKENNIEAKRIILESLYLTLKNSDFNDEETAMIGVDLAYAEINAHLLRNEPKKINNLHPSNFNYFILAVDFMKFED